MIQTMKNHTFIWWLTCYFIAGWVVLAVQPFTGPGFWYPSAGVATGLILLRGPRWWPLILICEFFIAWMQFRQGPVVAAMISGITMVQILATRWMLKRLRFDNSLKNVTDVLSLAFSAGLLGPLVSASLGTIFIHGMGLQAAGGVFNFWITWWIGQGIGMICVLPAILVWQRKDESAAQSLSIECRAATCLEQAVIYAIACLVCWFSFNYFFAAQNLGNYRFLMFVPVIWAALAYGPRFTSLLLVWSTAWMATLYLVTRPWLKHNDPLDHPGMWQAQLFILALGLMGVVLAVSIESERRGRKLSDEANQTLTDRGRMAALRVDVAAILASDDSRDGILHRCATLIAGHFEAESARVWVLDRGGSGLVLKAEVGSESDSICSSDQPLPVDGVLGLVVSDRRCITTRVDGTDGRTFLGYPLIVDGRVFGVIGLRVKGNIPPTIQDDLGTVADSIADWMERHEAQDHLARQAALLDKAQDAIIVRDLEHRITYWNKSAERLYGWTSDEVLGRSARDILYRDGESLDQVMPLLLKQGEWSGELSQKDKKDNDLVIEGHWTLVRDDEGHPRSVLAINTDISARKKLEQQFLRVQRLESIGTLAGGIAHDLNNVLAPIMMSIDLLRLRVQDSVGRKILDTIAASAKRGGQMVAQVLQFARGGELGERAPINTRALLDDLERFLVETFPKNIELRLSRRANLWLVRGDATQLYQVLLNLCVNARDSMPTGGTLGVAVDTVTVSEHNISINIDARPGHYTVFKVSDTGTGIPSAILDKIFDPFFTTKGVGKGTGLGLSTAMAIIKGHGGFLNVESEMDRGTCFYVYLPAEGEDIVQDCTIDTPDIPRGHGELVLVVDDEAAIREVTANALQTFGYRVLTADNGADGLAVYASRRSEMAIVLTDIMMPVMDGTSMVATLRRIDPHIPVVALSGAPTTEARQRLGELGVDKFLPKPLNASVLMHAVHTALQPGVSLTS